jgi:serpin B
MNAKAGSLLERPMGFLIVAVLLAVTCASADSVKSVVDANTTFALDLYQRQHGNTGNLFFSPYSISTALAMTYGGARGQTAKEMAQVLHFNLPEAQVHSGFASLIGQINELGKGKQLSLSVANSLWCQQSYHFTDSFLKLVHDSYFAEARLVDFIHQTEPTRRQINSWIEQKTQDKIRDLLQPGDLTPATRLVLCNAIYFKGNWTSQFETNATHTEPFFTAPDQKVDAPLMSQTEKVRSKQFDDFAILALPYSDNELSMVIVLPKAVAGLAPVESKLAQLPEWLTALDQAPEDKAQIFLPRFKLTLRLQLSRDLAAMGMSDAFGPKADFSGMTGAKDLCISEVVHQAFVDVNEQGTEAAAATALVMRSMAVMANPIPVFRMDHPFIFLIRENKTGSILFLGRLADPSK